MGWIDWAILGAFAAYAVSNGLRARRRASSGLEEYFLAGRSLSGVEAGMSMAATQFAADTPLLVMGLIATGGIFALWRLWIYALAFLLLGFLLSASWRRAGVLTDAELSELRYGGRAAAWLRGVKAVYFGVVFNCTVLAMVLWAAKEIAEPFLTWHAWLPDGLFAVFESAVRSVGAPFTRVEAPADLVWQRSTDNLLSIGAMVGLTLLYSATGGLRAVVRTDIVQLALMLIATAIYAGVAVAAAGGFGGIHEALAALEPIGGPGGPTRDEVLAFTPVHARDAGLLVLAVFGLQWLVQMNADGTGYLAQRSMACRSDRDARQAAVLFAFLQVGLRSLLWLPIGLALLVLFPTISGIGEPGYRAEREAAFVRGMAELMPAGARGLLFTAMIAALASTVDTHLNWGASYFTNDLYRRFICQSWLGRTPSPRELVSVARLSNLLILGLALAIMTQLSSIQVAWQISLLLGAGMGVLLLLRWFWWRVNGWGELACIAASSLLAAPLLALPPEHEALRLLLMALGATGAGIGVSLLTGPESPDRLLAFVDRARPPGFWSVPGRDPAAAARDRRRLGRGAAAVGLAALSLFCLLTAIGSWLVGSPSPLGPPGPWIAVLIVSGLALCPIWWRLGMRSPYDE